MINLLTTCEYSKSLNTSGRILRKLPMVSLSENFRVLPVPINTFLKGLARSVRNIATELKDENT